MQVEIDFFVTGNVRQEIELFLDIAPEEFVNGLKSGKYATSIGSDNIIEIETGKVIGRVNDQDALDDVEFTDYKVVER